MSGILSSGLLLHSSCSLFKLLNVVIVDFPCTPARLLGDSFTHHAEVHALGSQTAPFPLLRWPHRHGAPTAFVIFVIDLCVARSLTEQMPCCHSLERVERKEKKGKENPWCGFKLMSLKDVLL